ncbi:MAG: tRNA (adenine-N1)-methyltransferase [Litorilinea sp.]|nr:MAG: tRNA (adenine-N1)-methyltransferase [Litorilinea sp.]
MPNSGPSEIQQAQPAEQQPSRQEESALSPWFKPTADHARPGDLALLVTSDQKRYLLTLQPGQEFHTHQGIYAHDQIIGSRWGSAVYSQLEQPALVLQPGLGDLMMHLKRGTQIIYPKDAAYLVHRLNLRAGSRVVEAGTGSGSLTTALAWAVAPTGVVYSYETRVEIHHLARRNLERIGLLPYVRLFQASIDQGFGQKNVDAVFLDVREPWRYLEQVRAALCPGGFFASLVPTTNQVSDLIAALESANFADVAVEELLLRRYKPVPDRLRPEDSMIAHTGYLISARCIDAGLDPARWVARERQRYRARQKLAAEIAAREAERAQGEESGRKYPRLPLPG